MFRQGDVLIVSVASIPEGNDIPLENNRIILAYGEATGHTHSIKSNTAKFISSNNRRFLEILANEKLEHEEHDTITIPPGKYEVIQQQEYSPQAIRNVMD